MYQIEQDAEGTIVIKFKNVYKGMTGETEENH
jgi:hypothetical protein